MRRLYGDVGCTKSVSRLAAFLGRICFNLNVKCWNFASQAEGFVAPQLLIQMSLLKIKSCYPPAEGDQVT